LKTEINTLITLAAVIFCSVFFPAVTLSADQQPKIMMYGSETCYYCKAMRKNLDSEKIPYTYYDVNKDSAKNREMWAKVQTVGKFSSITFPIMDIDGKVLISPKFPEVKALLASNSGSAAADPAAVKPSGKPAAEPAAVEPVKNLKIEGRWKGISYNGDETVEIAKKGDRFIFNLKNTRKVKNGSSECTITEDKADGTAGTLLFVSGVLSGTSLKYTLSGESKRLRLSWGTSYSRQQ
jgi:glutaredoxin